MKIRLASILALLVCFVFTAAENTFAVGEFDNFRQSDAFRFNVSKNADFRTNDRFDVRFRNCDFATLQANQNFAAFGDGSFVRFVDNDALNFDFNDFDGNRRVTNFDFSRGLQRNFDRTSIGVRTAN